MLSRETEQRLVEIFITLSVGEEKINKVKQNILKNLDINPIQLFMNLDLDNAGYLNKNDFCSFLNFFSISFTPVDIDYIFFFYDKNEDNVLSFNEFLDLLVSDSNYFIKKSFKRKFKNKTLDIKELSEDLELKIEKAFLDLLIEEIDLGRHLNDLILNLRQYNDFNLQDIFYEIKSYSCITSDSLKAFFDRNEVNYNDKFIKNIFYRFDTKDINGKIVFNKFKNFFDLPFGGNNIGHLYTNNISKINLNQTHNSGDIIYSKINNNNNNYIDCESNMMNFQIPFEQNINNNDNNYHLRNYLFINEEDIQFKCSHLSYSGSIESFNTELQNSNCKYIPKNERKNHLYKNYLREKRSKSLEKGFRNSIINIKNIKPIYNEYNTNYCNYENNLNNSLSSFHEDLPVKLPIRLDKNLIQRKIPIRKVLKNNKKKELNFCYGDIIEDIKINNIHKNKRLFNNHVNNNKIINRENSGDIYYHTYNNIRDYDKNNFDFKTYQEDISKNYNNKKYY